jgi:hypothetical protein
MESRFKISSLWFDRHEELERATFWTSLSAHVAVAEALGVSLVAVNGPDQGVAITLTVDQMRVVAGRFQNGFAEDSVEGEIFVRTKAVLTTFRL